MNSYSGELVIACPVLWELATPTCNHGRGWKVPKTTFLKIKDAESLELSYKVNVGDLDKTGTITTPVKTSVTNWKWVSEQAEQDFSPILTCIKSPVSEHPLQEAVTKALKRKNNRSSFKIQDFQKYHRKVFGAESRIRPQYFVGEPKPLAFRINQLNLDSEISWKVAEKWQNEAKTVVFFANES